MYLSNGSRQPQSSRAGLVLALYGALALTAILISAGRGDVDIYRIEGVSTSSWLVLSPLLGVAFGLAVVFLSRMAVYRFDWARSLHRDFRSLLGELTHKEILILAVASAVGEELLFRGALQPWIGIWPQAAIFALLHIGPGFRFLPWTASAFVLGVGFGYMFQFTGDLGGPIAAHFTINYLNLGFIARTALPEPELEAAGTPGSPA
jgi:membrane protease YdiL (CAAX protease family)